MNIVLKTPVIIKGKEGQKDQTYTSLTLQRLKAKHLQFLPPEMFEMSGMNEKEIEENLDMVLKATGKMIPLIAGLAEVPEEVIGELEVDDLMEVANELGPFLSGLSGIGGNVSGQ